MATIAALLAASTAATATTTAAAGTAVAGTAAVGATAGAAAAGVAGAGTLAGATAGTVAGISAGTAGAAAGTAGLSSMQLAILTDVSLGMMGLTAYGSYAGAKQQEAYAEAAAKAQERAMQANVTASQEQADVERQKAINRAQLISSRIRVTAGESGLGMGGTAAALLRQSDYDVAANLNLIQRTATANYQSIISGGQAVSYPSPIGAGILGGMEGLSSGLNLGMGIAGAMKSGRAT